MYRAEPAPESLKTAFSTLARWTPRAGGRILLAADPGFEIVWSPESGPSLSPASYRSREASGGGEPLTFVRFRPGAIGAWLGSDAPALVGGASVPLGDLGARWRQAARATSLGELLWSLADRVGEGEPIDPLIRRSVERLGTIRPSSFHSLAALEGYSYEQWRRRMKAATGVSPKFLAQYFALQRASRLASRSPAMSMAEIAHRSGYASDSALANSSVRLSGRTFRSLVDGFDLPE